MMLLRGEGNGSRGSPRSVQSISPRENRLSSVELSGAAGRVVGDTDKRVTRRLGGGQQSVFRSHIGLGGVVGRGGGFSTVVACK